MEFFPSADLAPPNGETWQQFYRRVGRAWEELAPLAAGLDGHLALVSHALVCYSLARNQLQLPADEVASYALGNTAVTIVEPHPPWQVLRYNCCEHLDRPALPPAGDRGYVWSRATKRNGIVSSFTIMRRQELICAPRMSPK